jgi:ESX secretion system protein EccE
MWQAALVLGFVAAGRGWAVGIAVGTVAAGLLAVSAIRVRGVWFSTTAGQWVRFLLRRRVHSGQHLPLPAGTRIASDGVLVGAEGLTVCARTKNRLIPDAPELDLQLVVHRGPRQAGPAAWLAIGVRRDADAPGDDELRVTLANVLRRLRRAGHELSPLSAPELRQMLHGVSHAGPSRERRRSWQSGRVTQITLRLGATAAHLPALDRLLAEGRDAAVTAAVRATGDGVLRVAATSPDAAERAAARLLALGAHLGVRLHRLDGRHGPAVTASLPLGGDVR